MITPGGKTVKYKYGSREQFKKLNKIVQKVEMYLDNEGCFYVIPAEEENDNNGIEYKIIDFKEMYIIE